MRKYDFDATTRLWLKRRIGNHFAGRSESHNRRLISSASSNKNLRQVLHVPYAVMVRDAAGRSVKLVFHAGSEFVAFRSADSTRGIIAAIHDTDGSQYTFKGDRSQVVHWTGPDLHNLGRSRVRTSYSLSSLVE